jgi:hypothetical protein
LLVIYIKEGNKFVPIITNAYYIAKAYTTNSIMAVIEDVIDCADIWVDMLR